MIEERVTEGTREDRREGPLQLKAGWLDTAGKIWQLVLACVAVIALVVSIETRFLSITATNERQDRWIAEHMEYTKTRGAILDDVKLLVTRIDERLAAIDKAGEARDTMLRELGRDVVERRGK